MKTILWFAVLTLCTTVSAHASIVGDYVEARTSDVFTGPCFANGEVNLAGKEAVMVWRVRRGSWQGVDVGGLSVIAVVKANATLGDPFADPMPARSILVIDEKAKGEQRDALADFARTMGGELLADVIGIHAASIETENWRAARFCPRQSRRLRGTQNPRHESPRPYLRK